MAKKLKISEVVMAYFDIRAKRESLALRKDAEQYQEEIQELSRREMLLLMALQNCEKKMSVSSAVDAIIEEQEEEK